MKNSLRKFKRAMIVYKNSFGFKLSAGFVNWQISFSLLITIYALR